MKALTAARESVESMFLYAVAFAGMALSIPGVLSRNPLFLLGTAVAVGLKLGGVLDLSWWAATAPTWGPLALIGAHTLAKRARQERQQREATNRAVQAAAEGAPMGVFRRRPDGRREDHPVYVGTSDACLRYVRDHCADGDEAARRFVVQAYE